MQYKTLSIKRKGNLGILYLDRPEVLNALSETMFDELIHYMDQASRNCCRKVKKRPGLSLPCRLMRSE